MTLLCPGLYIRISTIKYTRKCYIYLKQLHCSMKVWSGLTKLAFLDFGPTVITLNLLHISSKSFSLNWSLSLCRFAREQRSCCLCISGCPTSNSPNTALRWSNRSASSSHICMSSSNSEGTGALLTWTCLCRADNRPKKLEICLWVLHSCGANSNDPSLARSSYRRCPCLIVGQKSRICEFNTSSSTNFWQGLEQLTTMVAASIVTF